MAFTSQRSRMYSLLGLEPKPGFPTPPPAEVRAAYYKMCLQHHPDKNPGDPQATAKFQSIKNAYELIMSNCVMIEDFLGEEVQAQESSPEDATPSFKMPKRARKGKEFIDRKSRVSEAEARIHLATKNRNREIDGLRTLMKQIKINEWKKRKFGQKITDDPNTAALKDQLAIKGKRLEDCNNVLNALIGGRFSWGLRKTKPLRPLPVDDRRLDEEPWQMLSPEFERELMAEVRRDRVEMENDSNFLTFEMPMEFVAPKDKERVRKRREKRGVAEELHEVEMRLAKEKGEKQQEFWNRREAAQKLKEPKKINGVQKIDRDLMGDSFKAVAITYTREFARKLESQMPMIEGETHHVEDNGAQSRAVALTPNSLEARPIPQNINLSLSSNLEDSPYVLREDRKTTWKEDLAVEKLEPEPIEYPRGLETSRGFAVMQFEKNGYFDVGNTDPISQGERRRLMYGPGRHEYTTTTVRKTPRHEKIDLFPIVLKKNKIKLIRARNRKPKRSVPFYTWS